MHSMKSDKPALVCCKLNELVLDVWCINHARGALLRRMPWRPIQSTHVNCKQHHTGSARSDIFQPIVRRVTNRPNWNLIKVYRTWVAADRCKWLYTFVGFAGSVMGSWVAVGSSKCYLSIAKRRAATTNNRIGSCQGIFHISPQQAAATTAAESKSLFSFFLRRQSFVVAATEAKKPDTVHNCAPSE